MEFRTKIKISQFPFQIDYNTKIFGLGSCFVDNMKQKFEYYQFQTLINDFGVIFNPVSLETILKRIVKKELFTEKDIFYHQENWKSFDLHSSLNQYDKKEMLKQVNKKIDENNAFLKQANLVIFTLGTAWVYKHKSTGKIVSNCHKVPAQDFEKLLLSPTQIFESLQHIIQLVKTLNPSVKILFTLSPVRHLKDGFQENQLSKAHLLSAIHQVIDNRQIFYFPSYEIMMDDLRDYRFYKDDFIHPNELAVNYIWELMQKSLISNATFEEMKKVEKVRKSLAHNFFDAQSDAAQKHQLTTEQKIKDLQKKYSWMKF